MIIWGFLARTRRYRWSRILLLYSFRCRWITCIRKNFLAPTNKNLSLSFSQFIESPFSITNLKISVSENYKYFILNNQTLSPNDYFYILNELNYFSNQSLLINIKFINYGVEIYNNMKTWDFNIKFCYERCDDCFNIESNETSHQCLKCKDGFYFIENTSNCMTIEEMENSNYYFDNDENKFKQCLNVCSTCDNGTYCKTCRKGYHFIYNETGKCISKTNEEDLLYLNLTNNTYMKCPKGTEKFENNECIKSSNISLIIILIIVILIIIIVLFFFIKRCISRKNLENEISNTLEKNDSDNQLINIFL